MNKTGVNLIGDVQATMDRVAGMPPEAKARAGHQMWEQVLAIQGMVAALRRAGVREMRARGYKYWQIAEMLDVSVTRVRQIEARDGKEAGIE